MVALLRAEKIDAANRLLRIAHNRAEQRRHMPQPTPDRVRFQDVAVVVALDEQVVPRVDDIDVEIERDEALRCLHALDGKIAEIEGCANPVDVEYDGDQRRAAGIAFDCQLGQQAAERDIGMRLGVEEGCAQVLQKLREGRIRIDAATQRQRCNAVRNEMAVLEFRLARDRDADYEVVLAG